MTTPDHASLLKVMDLYNACKLESASQSPNKSKIRALVLQMTEQLLGFGRETDSIFYGYQRLPKLSDALLPLLNADISYSPILDDFFTVVEGILLYEDLILSERIELFAKFTLMRHGETIYTNKGIDLTESGEQKVLSKKDILSGYVDKQKETVILVSSGVARTNGTLQLIFPDEERYTSDLVHILQIQNRQKAVEWMTKQFDSTMTPAQSIAVADRLFVERKLPETLFEPYSETEKQFFYSAEVALRFASKLKKQRGKVPHFFVVGHIEFLNHLVMPIFDLQVGNTVGPAEHIEICVLAKNGVLDATLVPLIVRFRNRVAKVYLNRQKGYIQK